MAMTRGTAGSRASASEKEILINRMKRIKGQAMGIERMIKEDRYCIDTVQQLSALSAAADEVALMVLQNHIKGCVASAVREQSGEDYIGELMVAVRKAIKR